MLRSIDKTHLDLHEVHPATKVTVTSYSGHVNIEAVMSLSTAYIEWN